MIHIQIQTEPFNTLEEEKKLEASADDCGAMVSFKGMVRGHDQAQALSHLYLEHFPKVTEQEIARIIERAQARWHIPSCTVIHRVGELHIGDDIVLVMVAAKHRKEAFDAAEFIMDYLKTEAPFWKKEFFQDGSAQWVAAKASDAEKQQQWSE